MATIMVLDDDPVILDLLRTVLTDFGHTVLSASDLQVVPVGATADLVVIDLIPLKDYRRGQAMEWVASVRARFTGTPLIIVTAHAAALAESDRLGADAIIAKPFDVDTLAAKVKELIG